MNDILDILDYEIHWRSKSQSGFIGELHHVVRNNSGGSLSTPVGNVVGFIEPASDFSPEY